VRRLHTGEVVAPLVDVGVFKGADIESVLDPERVHFVGPADRVELIFEQGICGNCEGQWREARRADLESPLQIEATRAAHVLLQPGAGEFGFLCHVEDYARNERQRLSWINFSLKIQLLSKNAHCHPFNPVAYFALRGSWTGWDFAWGARVCCLHCATRHLISLVVLEVFAAVIAPKGGVAGDRQHTHPGDLREGNRHSRRGRHRLVIAGSFHIGRRNARSLCRIVCHVFP